MLLSVIDPKQMLKGRKKPVRGDSPGESDQGTEVDRGEMVKEEDTGVGGEEGAEKSQENEGKERHYIFLFAKKERKKGNKGKES